MSWLPLTESKGIYGSAIDHVNALTEMRNANELRKINAVKAQYAPLTTQAEAASKLAYSNLMGPQFLAKAFSDPNFLAGLDENQKTNAINTISRAAAGQNPMELMKQLNQQPQTQNPLKHIVNSVKDAFGFGEAPVAQSNNSMLDIPIGGQPRNPMANTQNLGNNSPLSNADLNGMSDEFRNDMKQHVTPQNRQAIEDYENNQAKTLATKRGEFEGTATEEKELGKFRAQNLEDIGREQLALSKSGVSLDRMINIIKSPDFQELRSSVPFFQDKQLNLLSKTGNKKQQDLIGDFITTSQSMMGDAVNSFQGKAMAREFDYAQRLKINDNDTVGVAEGKLRALKTLKEIAETKNDLVYNHIKNDHMDLAKAIKQADKEIDIKPIERQVDQLLEPRIKITNNKTGESIYVTKSEAKRMTGEKK